MKISYVVLYLKDTKQGLDFWVNKMGYEKKSETKIGTEIVYKVGEKGDNTNFELVPLKLMENNPYKLNLGIPSIAFEADDLTLMHTQLKEKGVKVTDIIQHGNMDTFTVFDYEQNAYAVIKK